MKQYFFLSQSPMFFINNTEKIRGYFSPVSWSHRSFLFADAPCNGEPRPHKPACTSHARTAQPPFCTEHAVQYAESAHDGHFLYPSEYRKRPSARDTLYGCGACTTPAALDAGSEFRLLAVA